MNFRYACVRDSTSSAFFIISSASPFGLDEKSNFDDPTKNAGRKIGSSNWMIGFFGKVLGAMFLVSCLLIFFDSTLA